MQRPTHALLFALAASILAPPAAAQIAATVGPVDSPIGCTVAITISNDTHTPVWTGVCPYRVRDASGAVVYTPICIAIATQILPGGTFTMGWPQIDDNGSPVAPGAYFVDVFLPGGAGTSSHAITIAGLGAGIAPLGVPKISSTRHYRICSPQDGGFGYLFAASGSNNTGIGSCAGTVPLDVDEILVISLSDPATFQNGLGTLDPTGMTDDPAIAIPPTVTLIGLQVHLAALVLDFSAPCPIRRISAPFSIVIA